MAVVSARDAARMIAGEIPRPSDGITITGEMEAALDAALNEFGYEGPEREKLRAMMLKTLASAPVN